MDHHDTASVVASVLATNTISAFIPTAGQSIASDVWQVEGEIRASSYTQHAAGVAMTCLTATHMKADRKGPATDASEWRAFIWLGCFKQPNIASDVLEETENNWKQPLSQDNTNKNLHAHKDNSSCKGGLPSLRLEDHPMTLRANTLTIGHSSDIEAVGSFSREAKLAGSEQGIREDPNKTSLGVPLCWNPQNRFIPPTPGLVVSHSRPVRCPIPAGVCQCAAQCAHWFAS